MLFIEGRFLGFKTREGRSKQTGEVFNFPECGIAESVSDGFGGFRDEVRYLDVSNSIMENKALMAKYESLKGKNCRVSFWIATTKKDNKTYYNWKLNDKEPELIK